MPVNVLLESKKWQLLSDSAQPISFGEALSSYFAGIAISILTPNRIGEYPGRLLYLKRKNTIRLAGVSILGMMAQLLTAFIYGLAGLIYFNIKFPGTIQSLVLLSCIICIIVIAIAYWRFEMWMPFIERIKWLRKYNVYSKLLKDFTFSQQLTILLITILRYGIYTAQYLILLRWVNIYLPPAEGFIVCGLFFWIITVVPTIALAELGTRGQVSLYLFHHFTSNSLGIIVATVTVWCINLILPAIVGSLLLLYRRFIN